MFEQQTRRFSSKTWGNFHKTVTIDTGPLCYSLVMENRSSIVGSFFKGALSSAFSGALMAGIVSLVTPMLGSSAFTLAAVGTTLAATAPMMILATGLFGGVMGIKRAMFDAPSASRSETNVIPVPVAGMSGPALAPSISADMAPQTDQPTRNWVASTGREGDAQSRIQQIISQGSMSDKDRASAILAAREAAASTETLRG
jgi:hypothetical protein